MSIASERPWFAASRRDIARACAPILCLALAWWLLSSAPTAMIMSGVLVYALAQLGLIMLRRSFLGTDSSASKQTLVWLAVGGDLLLSLFLLQHISQLGSTIYPLYLLLTLRAISAYRSLPAAAITPFLLGPTYVFTYYTAFAAPPAASAELLEQWILLFGSLSFGVAAIWVSATQRRVNVVLRQELRSEQLEREARVGDLERSANDLRARMRQLHALEEGLRVITSTLSLDEVLNQIVDSTVQMLGAPRVHGMILSLRGKADFDHRLFLLDSQSAVTWPSSVARRAMQQQVPLIIGDTALDAELAESMPRTLRSALCVPLFVGDGPPQGALTVVSTAAAVFSSSDARHLTALAIQAGIAIHNAELHSRLRQQQRLLQAVVRDINDGLVVVDSQSQIVLSNPIGRALLDDEFESQYIQSQLLALSASLRAENKPQLTCELRLKPADEEEPPRVYEAFGSQVRHSESEEPLVAIVLHDITEQKVEEQSRVEFISMVAHELRNPLNSLNGFIKVVLRGQAGALTALQHEFLEIADGQVEQLKGRISELLEYNRVEARQLVLNPQWHDLSLLIAGTATRLGLHAEQNGLTLVNEVGTELPECVFDSERIGQVLNNLIENAIKATPPGGTITLRSQQHADEVWVRVCDTGVGIALEDQSKIFQRFYRAHNRKSSQGNHLGLGLAICQQIIASHMGRLWVESEEGQGSCFTFALPLNEREAVVNGL